MMFRHRLRRAFRRIFDDDLLFVLVGLPIACLLAWLFVAAALALTSP